MSGLQFRGLARELNPTRTCVAFRGAGFQHEKAPTDFLFRTNIKVVSPQLNFAYNLYDNVGAISLQSGEYAVDPTFYDDHDAFSEGDTITVYYLQYGKSYKAATFGVTRVETLAYLSHDVNPNVTLSEAAAGALSGITVNSGAKTITVNGRSQSEVYDYLQYYQNIAANVTTLIEGEIFSTVLGTNFNLLDGWSLIFNAAPVGAWNITTNQPTQFNFAGTTVTNFVTNNDIQFNFDGTQTYTFDGVECVDIATESGIGTETVIIDLIGDGFTYVTNNDPTNITVNAPALTLTINNFVTGSDVVIYDAAAPATGDGSNVLQTFDAVAGTSIGYVYDYVPGTIIDVGVFKDGYIPRIEKGIELSSTSATIPITNQLDRNYT